MTSTCLLCTIGYGVYSGQHHVHWGKGNIHIHWGNHWECRYIMISSCCWMDHAIRDKGISCVLTIHKVTLEAINPMQGNQTASYTMYPLYKTNRAICSHSRHKSKPSSSHNIHPCNTASILKSFILVALVSNLFVRPIRLPYFIKTARIPVYVNIAFSVQK